MDEKIVVEFEREAFDELTQRAEAHGRDVAGEVRSIVLDTIATRPSGVDWIARASAIRAMTPSNVPQTDSLTLLREDRDR